MLKLIKNQGIDLSTFQNDITLLNQILISDFYVISDKRGKRLNFDNIRKYL